MEGTAMPVSLTFSGRTLTLQVVDDGVGARAPANGCVGKR
jgi:hypothetical protein